MRSGVHPRAATIVHHWEGVAVWSTGQRCPLRAVRFFNILEGRGLGVLIAGLALRSARKGADAFAQTIKATIEASDRTPANPPRDADHVQD